LAVDDEAETLLSLEFSESVAGGEYKLDLGSSDNLSSDNISETIVINADPTTRVIKKTIKLKAKSQGVGTLNVKISKDGKVLSSKNFDLALRSKYPIQRVFRSGLIKPEEKLSLRNLLTDNLLHHGQDLKLKVSGAPALADRTLRETLLAYQHRCAEQTTSRAFPWLELSRTSESAILINNAIQRLLSYQNPDGGFGLWENEKSALWISAFVMEFLLGAKKTGFKVRKSALEHGLKYLEDSLYRWADEGKTQEANAYALYSLSLGGRNLISDVKYHANNPASTIRSPLAWAQLGFILARVGENQKAEELFTKSQDALNKPKDYHTNYGGYLRDLAAVTFLLQKSELEISWDKYYLELARAISKRKYFSTQEMSWILRLANINQGVREKFKLKIGDKLKEFTSFRQEYINPKETPELENPNTNNLWYEIDFKAQPALADLRKEPNSGFSIKRSFYKLGGDKIILNQVETNDRLVAVIEGVIKNKAAENPLIVDVIPAGFEIENPAFSNVNPIETISWLGKLSPTRFSLHKDDRFIGAISPAEDGKFKLAYLVRAVTKGKYSMQAVSIEDMYQPWLRATDRNALGQTVHISSAEKESISPKTKPLAQRGIKDLGAYEYNLVYDKTLGSTEIAKFSVVQLNTLRNSIFARAGLNFSQSKPLLHETFTGFDWYVPDNFNSAMVYQKLSKTRQDNIQFLLAAEKTRLGDLTLSDFYRVNARTLNDKDLKKYNQTQLNILRNSLFARHGLSFPNHPDMSKIYQQLPWYQPSAISSAVIYDEIMGESQKANVQILLEAERTRK